MPPVNISRENIGQGLFLSLDRITWKNHDGKMQQWETADRVAQARAVGIIAWLKPSGRLLLIRQYRPPIGQDVIEFPAGLIDPGESPEQAAVRELREETGYVAENIKLWPAGASSAGMTSECIHLVSATIDETKTENKFPKTDFHDDESIECLFFHPNEFSKLLQDAANQDVVIDAKLLSYLLAYYRA